MTVIDDLIRREGSTYTNDPIDGGGPTRWGITLATLSKWRGRQVTPEAVAALQEWEARQIYAAQYVQPWEWVASVPLREFLVDSTVQHGMSDAARFLQAALGIVVDGYVGPKTRAALKDADPVPVRLRCIGERMVYYGRLVERDPSQSRFIEGWLIRLREFLWTS